MHTFQTWIQKHLTFQPPSAPVFSFPEETSAPHAPQTDRKPAVFSSCEKNLTYLKDVFSYPQNADIKIRTFSVGETAAFLIFIEGMVDDDAIATHILAPLMLLGKGEVTKERLEKHLLLHNQLSFDQTFDSVLEDINMGNCAVFADGVAEALICDVKNWQQRAISPPLTESVINGPQEGFTENFKVNTALIRKIIRDETLLCEVLSVGQQSKTPCAFLYMKDIANDELVQELKRRLFGIGADYIYQLGELEQFLEGSTFSLVPQFLTTERPDRAASALIEGKIVLILQGTPMALIAPTTFSELLTTVEDKNDRFPFANFTKLIRLLGILISFLLPGLYIAILRFHHDVLPTDLLFAIEATREAVPFSALTELLLMELSFDLIREASIRVPSPVGSTLGIIGGLIVGQAAVSANLVSPISIIIVSLTGIGSFATPNHPLTFTLRCLRYLYSFLGAFAGFFSIAAGLFVHSCLLAATDSLGVSLFTSLTSGKYDKIPGFLFIKPIFQNEFRHSYLNAKIKRVQQPISRKWDHHG